MKSEKQLEDRVYHLGKRLKDGVNVEKDLIALEFCRVNPDVKILKKRAKEAIENDEFYMVRTILWFLEN